jgi:hypothetical protein
VTDIAESLRIALDAVHWQTIDLWVGAAAIGGHFSHSDVDDITSGARAPTRAEYDVLATTINERFRDLGGDHPMPLWAQL